MNNANKVKDSHAMDGESLSAENLQLENQLE